ncbi:MAG TPA: hypothetical protein VFR67_09695 [Pilimelia sp.]|nr:hypothetical protein [Pilimelia sp.]
MRTQGSRSIPGTATVAGLIVGALGIGVLWASGVEFPFAVPPGIVILLVGAAVVALAPWRWAPGVGAFLGLFVTVGFLISPTGIPNFLGQHGTSVAIGTWIQLAGVLTALVAGVMATRNNYHGPAPAPR